MAKRFTDSAKWDDPWFRRLAPSHKLVWLYLLDRCDWAGIWQVDKEAAQYHIGDSQIDWAGFWLACNDDEKRPRLAEIGGGKLWWITKFCLYQFPDGLSERCKPHLPAIRSLHKHGLAEQVATMYRDLFVQRNRFALDNEDSPSAVDAAAADKQKLLDGPPGKRPGKEFVGLFCRLYREEFDSDYQPTKADWAQLAKFLRDRVGISPDRFGDVAKSCWARGRYKPSASLTIGGLCSKWDVCVGVTKSNNTQRKGKEYQF